MRKKILFVLHGLPVGGTEKAFLAMLKNIDRIKYDVKILLLEGNGVYIDEVPGDVPIEIMSPKYALYINPLSWGIQKKLFLTYPVRMLKKIGVSVQAHLKNRDERVYDTWEPIKNNIPMHPETFDVVIDYDGFCKEYILDKVHAKVKISWNHFDYSFFEKDKIIDRIYFKRLDYIVSVSDSGVRSLVEFFPDLSEKFIAIYNILDADQIRERAKIQEVALPKKGENIFICSVGRLEAQKDFSFAIETASLLKEKGLEFIWYIIGEGSERQKLELLIKGKKLENNVLLLGQQMNPYSYMEKCDLYVQTSKYEGLSVAVAEAMILCKPIIVVDVQGLREYVENGKCGIVSKRTPEHLAESVLSCSLRERECMSNSLKNYDWSGKKSMDIFYKLIEG